MESRGGEFRTRGDLLELPDPRVEPLQLEVTLLDLAFCSRELGVGGPTRASM